MRYVVCVKCGMPVIAAEQRYRLLGDGKIEHITCTLGQESKSNLPPAAVPADAN